MSTNEQVLALSTGRTAPLTQHKIMTLAGGFLLLEAALWTPRPYQTVLSLLTLAYVVVSVVRRGHSAAEVGFSQRGLLRGWWTLGVALAFCGFLMLLALWADTLHVVTQGRAMYAGSLLYLIWALEQEFMLQGFFFLGLKQLIGERLAIIGSALVFAVAHLPNPILTVATLLGGIFFTVVFARYRNLILIAVLHALLGISLAITAPDSLNHHMRVGLGYLRYHVGIAPSQPPVPIEPRRASFVGRDQIR